MKTSNKLLILLAILLIIVPIISIAVNIKMNYTYVAHEDYIFKQEINNEPFNTNPAQRVKVPIATAFNYVNLPDAKGVRLEIHLLNSAVSGIKVPSFAKDLFDFKVDQKGVLNITIKGEPYQGPEIPISIYGPNFKGINVSNTSMLVLSAVSDSLLVNLNHIQSFSLSGEIYKNDNQGKVIKSFNGTNVGKLTLNLTNSEFSSEGHSYNDLTINTQGVSNISLNGDENAKDRYSIKNLSINTRDTAEVNLNNINISKLSGNISDHTKILAPVANLKQLFGHQ